MSSTNMVESPSFKTSNYFKPADIIVSLLADSMPVRWHCCHSVMPVNINQMPVNIIVVQKLLEVEIVVFILTDIKMKRSVKPTCLANNLFNILCVCRCQRPPKKPL